MAVLQLNQPIKIVSLVALNTESLHQMQNHSVIVAFHLITAIFLRPEVAGNAKTLRIGNHNRGRIIRHPLGNGNMSLKTLILLACKVNKTAHGIQKSSGNGNPKPQSSCKTAAAGIRLVKIIKHLIELGIRHTDTRIIDINGQINTITLSAAFDTHMDTALFRKLDGIFQKNLKYMGNLFSISNQHGRNSRVHVKHHFQLMPAPLHGRHGNHIIDDRGKHIFLLCGGQRSLHNLRIIQHIIDLIG